MKHRSNYQLQREAWQARFLEMDMDALLRRLPELKMDGENLLLYHFGRLLAVNRQDGSIRCLSDARPVSHRAWMNVLTLFYYCSPSARVSGQWLPFERLRNASPFAAAFQKGVLQPLADTFNGHETLLEPAVRRLGGTRISRNGYWLPAFSCIPVRLHFWDGDDEFPAQANLLFDAAVVDWIHVESVVTIAAEAVCLLSDAAGLPRDCRLF